MTVTHPRIERYFMTIPEAVHLVLFAAAMEQGGETFILDMGQPVKIDRLARDIIVFAGLTPDVDVPIVYTGLRPGEKLYEELWTTREQPQPTAHPGIMVSPGMDERPGPAPAGGPGAAGRGRAGRPGRLLGAPAGPGAEFPGGDQRPGGPSAGPARRNHGLRSWLRPPAPIVYIPPAKEGAGPAHAFRRFATNSQRVGRFHSPLAG